MFNFYYILNDHLDFFSLDFVNPIFVLLIILFFMNFFSQPKIFAGILVYNTLIAWGFLYIFFYVTFLIVRRTPFKSNWNILQR
jgi:hypothetical protein